MSNLSELAESDPEAAKDALSELASAVREEASSASGEDAKKLTELADKFAQAAETGDLSALRPPSRDGAEASGGASQAALPRGYQKEIASQREDAGKVLFDELISKLESTLASRSASTSSTSETASTAEA